jgi:hypothetical protein
MEWLQDQIYRQGLFTDEPLPHHALRTDREGVMTFLEIGWLVIVASACLCGVIMIWGVEMRSIKRMELQTWWTVNKATKPTNGGPREL